MARPIKEGLDYFPLDVNIYSDDKFDLILSKYGLTGFGIIINLYIKVYEGQGYYYSWGEKEELKMERRIGVEVKTIRDVVIDCFNEKIFDEQLYNQFGILTSRGIQSRYFKATERRKRLKAIKEFILIDMSEYSNVIIASINSVNASNNSTSVDSNEGINTQSKEKKSKRENIVNLEERNEKNRRDGYSSNGIKRDKYGIVL